MRLLHVSDLHFRRPWFEWVSTNAKNYDGVCLSGDLLDLWPMSTTDLTQQVRWVLGWMRDFPIPLFICSGNHDWWLGDEGASDPDAEARWLKRGRRAGVRIDGDTKIFAGRRFVSVGWLEAIAIDGGEPVILLAHAPPEGTAVSTDRAGVDCGDFELRLIAERLPRGSLVLSGHTHEPRSWHDRIAGVCCLNPGVDFDSPKMPNHIVIDTDNDRAIFQSLSVAGGPIRF